MNFHRRISSIRLLFFTVIFCYIPAKVFSQAPGNVKISKNGLSLLIDPAGWCFNVLANGKTFRFLHLPQTGK